LNEQAGGAYYRLPTEAEWEYVAKAGQSDLWSFGNDLGVLSFYVYYAASGPQARGLTQANPWGVYDLYGNVYEWVQDWYVPFKSETLGACPPLNGQYKVIRGGSVNCETRWLRSASRNLLASDHSSYAVGLRLVRVDQPD
jgi:formylglycine-generating enzyme required for sulfatase activity